MVIDNRAAWGLLAIFFAPSAAFAEPASYCVICNEPDHSYICEVETPDGSPGDRALRLYCIVRTARDGGHRSCALSRDVKSPCLGELKHYTYSGPTLPDHVISTIRRHRDRSPGFSPHQGPGVVEAKKPPTLLGVTSRAIKATGRKVKKTGGAITNATKNVGARVGNAARTALDCIKKLFHGCGEDDRATTADTPPEAAQAKPR